MSQSRWTDDPSLVTSPTEVERVRDRLVEFVETVAEDAPVDRAVVTLDGTPTSAALAALVTDALGSDRLDALVMPAFLSGEAAARDAEAVAATLGVESTRIQLQPLLAAFREAMGNVGTPADDVIAVQNALERFRMACAYYVANTSDGMVFGDVTRTDRLLGSVTKHGDVGVDALPFGDLYYTEVRALGTALDVPDTVTSNPRSGFGGVPTDAAELGVDERTLDELLLAVVDENRPAEVVAEDLDVTTDTVERVEQWHAATAHKRHQPQTPKGLL